MHPTTRASKRTRARRTWPILAALGAVLLGIALAAVASHLADRRPASAPTTTPTVLHLTGQGDAAPAFSTGPDWSLTYTYVCPSAGAFRVVERGGVQNGVALADLAGTGTNATTYVHNVPGVHQFLVETGCTWTLTVVNGDTMPRAGGAA